MWCSCAIIPATFQFLVQCSPSFSCPAVYALILNSPRLAISASSLSFSILPAFWPMLTPSCQWDVLALLLSWNILPKWSAQFSHRSSTACYCYSTLQSFQHLNSCHESGSIYRAGILQETVKDSFCPHLCWVCRIYIQLCSVSPPTVLAGFAWTQPSRPGRKWL